ncbi:MAG TPA: efflux RND transporter periplasmic adaptor subunit [Opitutaceae bacterium]|nr:efflux RND transporter periplasmic adaptor subunit [Opitutaceae bacterium]
MPQLSSPQTVPNPSAMAANAPAAPRRKSPVKWLIIGSALFIVLVALAFIFRRRGGEITAVITEKAAVRDLTQLVTATGKIQPEVEVKITPDSVYGEIVALPFQEGDTVKKGDLLVKIKPDFYQAQVEQQTAAVNSARAAAVLSQAKLEKAEQDWKQYQDLYQRKLVSDSDYTLYKTNYDGAQAAYASALANVQENEGLLNQARDQLSKTIIYSPMDGTVSSRSCEVGERVVATGQFSGTEIMRVADLSSMEARVDVNENDVVNVKPGDHALISIDAYPGRKFNGTVKEIAATGTTTGTGTQSEVTNFQVKIRITDHDVKLRPGMSATADIETQTVKGAVTVPIQSVTVRDLASGKSAEEVEQARAREAETNKGDNQASVTNLRDQARASRTRLPYVVFIKEGDHVRLQKVDMGISDDTYTEIKSGVKPGDEVVSGSYTAISRTLKDGMKVRLEKPVKPKQP